jgi:hypothetical protein
MQLKDWKTKGFILLLWTAVLPSRGVFAQQDKFVGTWNYDEPSPTTRVNMATIPLAGSRGPRFHICTVRCGGLILAALAGEVHS